jgi:putative ABC transport system substrate-binding protein
MGSPAMNRREAFAALAALAAPAAFCAQPAPRRVGVLVQSRIGDLDVLTLLEERLRASGFAEGRDVEVRVESVELDPSRASDAARRIVAARPDVIYGVTEPLVDALRKEAGTIPIVFAAVTEPIARGYVRTHAKPGGTLTGVTDRYVEIGLKRLELLREIAPRSRKLAFLRSDEDELGLVTWRNAARQLGFEVVEINTAREARSLVAALEDARSHGVDGIFPIGLLRDPADPVANAVPAFMDYVRRHRLPVVFSSTAVVQRRGGLASIEIDSAEAMRLGAEMVVRILRGENPALMPVQEPGRFIVAVNVRSAREMGIAFPRSVMLRATHVVD